MNVESQPHPYYADKAETLADLFGQSVVVGPASILTGGRELPIIDDVIILSSAGRSPESIRGALQQSNRAGSEEAERTSVFSDEVQRGFGREWQDYSDILPEHAAEFASYFDLVDLSSLHASRVCDFGCGSGRWSHFIAPHCREIVLVDFSDAIFVARRNLKGVGNALFFMGDVTALPFRRDCADFAFSLGVLHHLPSPALPAVVRVSAHAPVLLVYLYYALDNRPGVMRGLLWGVTRARNALTRVRNPRLRRLGARAIAVGVYKPMIGIGHLFQLFGKGASVPLYEWYRGMSLKRIEQDAYDRFFTSIEQRVTRKQIHESLAGEFSSVVVSERPPYWHFVCSRPRHDKQARALEVECGSAS